MNFTQAGAIADAILYEGYMLYPYRRSALKNRAGWTLGVVAAHAGDTSSKVGCECLVAAGPATAVEARLRFLMPLGKTSADVAFPCEVTVPATPLGALEGGVVVTPFAFTREDQQIEGHLELAASSQGTVSKLRVTVVNLTAANVEAGAQAGALVSTHVLLGLRDGEFVPLREPPPDYADLAASCRHDGLWPILVGERDRRDLVIASPVILEDYPQIAPESPSTLFDGTEIDEILTLRILTLAPEERDEIARGDPRVRALLERAEAMDQSQLARLHGTMRAATPAPPRTLLVRGREVGAGDRVRLRPTKRSDVMDLVLTGRLATVVSVEQDVDDRTYFAVTVDEDPGKDLGALGKTGHRFFFGPDEVELVPA